MLEVFIDSLLDSLKVLAFVFAIQVLFSFFEVRIAHLLKKSHRLAPLFGSTLGLLPQCGVSVVAADLFEKRHISIGTLIAVFISCNDEALGIILSDVGKGGKWYMAFLLVGIKLVLGFTIGVIVDLVIRSSKPAVEDHLRDCHDHDTEETHTGCCGHHIDDEHEPGWKAHLVHPLLHSLKIVAWVFVIMFAFGSIIHLVGKEKVSSFISSNVYLSPVLASLIGLVPNCASSVLVTSLYIDGAIPFGALLAGLVSNAGLGLVTLSRSKNGAKSLLVIIPVLLLVALVVGYSLIWLR